MAAGFSEIMLIFLMLTGGAGNDLLDYISPDQYWKLKGVEVSAQTINAELKAEAKAAGGPGGAKAASVRKLMAIRTAGTRKLKETVPQLQELVKSTEPFIADYAQQAIATIEGKAYTRPGPTAAQLKEDVGLMPRNVGMVAQVSIGKLQGTASVDELIKETLKAMPAPAGPNADPAAQLTQAVVGVAERTGNIRIDSVTIGVAEDVGPNKGFAAFIFRGTYDRQAILDMFRQMGIPVSKSGETDVVEVERSVRLLAPSDQRFVMVPGAKLEELPVEAFVKAFKASKGELELNTKLTALIQQTDTTKLAWISAIMSDSFREAPVFAPYDTIRGHIDIKDDTATHTIVGTAASEEKLNMAMEDLIVMIEQGLTELKMQIDQVPPQIKPMLQTSISYLESLDVKPSGKQLTVTGSIKGLRKLMFQLPTMFFSAGMRF